MKISIAMLAVVCAVMLVCCGPNEKEIVKQELKLRIEYVKSEKYLKAENSDTVTNDIKDIRVKLLGSKNIGETEFSLMQDKYSNDPEIVSLQREFVKAWNDAFAAQMKRAWKRKQ